MNYNGLKLSEMNISMISKRIKEMIRDKEYYACIKDLYESEPCMEMNTYIQHGNTTTLEHCVSVSYLSYKIAKKYNMDYRSAARGGLLHDLFLYDWHTHRKKTGNMFHGYTHPGVALRNAEKHYKLSDKEKNIIKRHMWPLTPIPPKSGEGLIVMLVDKYCSTAEVVREIKFLSMFQGAE